MSKPIYSVSASLLNSIKWLKKIEVSNNRYKTVKTKKAYEDAKEQLASRIRRDYFENEYTKRGQDFEAEAYTGKHPQFGIHFEVLDKQKWFNKYIEYKDFKIKITGQVDAYDKELKKIYDLKRTNEYKEEYYNDDSTVQHDIYFYLIPEAETFDYLVASKRSLDNVDLQYDIVTKKRKEDTEQYVITLITELLQTLHEEKLLELYLTNFRAKF